MEGCTSMFGKTTHAQIAWWLLKLSLIPMSLKTLK